MAQSGAASNVRRDNVLVPFQDVEWISKNVFTVSVDLYQRIISCELSAVDVPRGTASVLESTIDDALQAVRQSRYRFLRQDNYATFPIQGYGDVVYALDADGTRWCSLQESLLRLGVARIIRPIASRLDALLAAELEGEKKGARCPWAARLAEFERGPHFNVTATGKVVNVLRGDVYMIAWDKPSLPTSAPPLQSLLLLDTVVCHSSHTDAGYDALRWAQRRLLQRRVNATVLCTSPSEQDVANNTQLFRYEQLHHVRAALRVVDEDGANGSGWDVACALVTAGHGLVRQRVDAAIPRGMDFRDVLRAARDFCKKCDGATIANSTSATSNAADVRAVNCVVDISDVLPVLPNEIAVTALMEFIGPVAASLPMLWRAVVWAGDFTRDVHDDPPRTHISRPLRSLLPLHAIVRLAMTLNGVVRGVAVVTAGRPRGPDGCRSIRRSLQNMQNQSEKTQKEGKEPSQRCFLRIDVDAVLTEKVLREARDRVAAATSGTLSLQPPNGTVVGPLTVVTAAYSRGALPESVTAYLSIATVACAPGVYDPRQHRPPQSADILCVSAEEEGAAVTESLRLPVDSAEILFVVDVVVEFSDGRAALRQRALYHAVSALPDDEEDDEDNMGDENDEDADGGGREEPSAQSEAARSINMTAVPACNHAAVDFYMEIDPAVCRRTSSEGTVKELRAWAADLLGRDVCCAPVGIASVNGHNGFLGDVVIADDRDDRSRRSSILHDLCERHWLRAEVHHNLASKTEGDIHDGDDAPVDVAAAVLRLLRERWARLLSMVCMDEASQRTALAVSSVEALRRLCARHLAMAELPPATKAKVAAFAVDPVQEQKRSLDAKMASSEAKSGLEMCEDGGGKDPDNVDNHDANRGDFAEASNNDGDKSSDDEDDDIFTVAVGASVMWREADDDSSDTDSDCSGPPMLSTTFFPSHVPLFTASIFPRQFFYSFFRHHRSIAGRAHLDTAFMRLPRRSLANLHASNFERLPVALRNTERAFCESLLYPDTEADVLYAAEPVFARLLAMILMLQPREDTVHSTTRNCSHCSHTHSAVYEKLENCAYEIDAPFIFSEAVLYRVGGPPPRLFFGKPDSHGSDAFDAARCDLPLDSNVLLRALGALGLDSLLAPRNKQGTVASLVPCTDAACLPLGARGFGPDTPSGTAPRLYRPLPWLAVLGPPLVARDECSADTLGQGRRHVTAECAVRRHVALTYQAVRVHKRRVYRAFSYGQIRRRDIQRMVRLRARKGGEVVDYFSLLLRRRAGHGGSSPGKHAGGFADGALRVYGTAHEPLYIFYQARRQLRFRLGMLWPSLLAESDDTEEEAEEQLLCDTAKVARDAINMIAQKTASDAAVPPSLVYMTIKLALSRSPNTPQTLRIALFPVDSTAPQKGKGNENPHQRFNKSENVYGRLERHVLVVRYQSQNKAYSLEWDELLEKKSSPEENTMESELP